MIELSEHQIQCQIVEYLRYKGTLCFAVPNGLYFNSKSKQAGASYMRKLKREVFRPGASDLVIVYPDKVLWAEIKTHKGTLSGKQKEFRDEVEEIGYEYQVFRSLDEFIEWSEKKWTKQS